MRFVRWGLAGLTALYALVASMPMVLTWAFKAGALPAEAAGSSAGLMADIPPPLLLAWTAMGLLYLASAVLQFRRDGRALPAFALAWGLDVVIYFVMSTYPAFAQVFSAGQDLQNRIVLGLVALLGVGVWWSGRGGGYGRPSAAGRELT